MQVLLPGKPFLFPFPWLTLIPYSDLRSEFISSSKPSLVFLPTLLWGMCPVPPSHNAGLFVCLSSQLWIVKRQRLSSSSPQHLAWAWSDWSSGHAFEQMIGNISWTRQSCDSRERGASQPSELTQPLKAREDILKDFVTPTLGHQKAEAGMILLLWVRCKKQGQYWGERWQWGEGWKKWKGKKCKKSISIYQMSAKYMNDGLLCCIQTLHLWVSSLLERRHFWGYWSGEVADTDTETQTARDGPLVRHNLCGPIRSMDATGGTCIVEAGRPGAGMGLAWASGIASFVSQIMQFYVISILLFMYL